MKGWGRGGVCHVGVGWGGMGQNSNSKIITCRVSKIHEWI